jgi:hypothetical protein
MNRPWIFSEDLVRDWCSETGLFCWTWFLGRRKMENPMINLAVEAVSRRLSTKFGLRCLDFQGWTFGTRFGLRLLDLNGCFGFLGRRVIGAGCCSI